MKANAFRALLAVSLVALPGLSIGSEPLEARVYPVEASAPADVLVEAIVEPDGRNRSIEFVVDSGTFYSSHMVDLDGNRSARTQEARFRRLPAGTYEIRVTLRDADGERATTMRHIAVF